MSPSPMRVTCFRCKCPVDEISAVQVKTVTNERKYECVSCNKKSKTPLWSLKGGEVPVKKALYCAQCKYKFSSKSTVCPLCGNSDNVMKADVSMKELL
ncbi:MAG: hypothetical protein AB1668_01065 [Nanoarchaeota archaeon]